MKQRLIVTFSLPLPEGLLESTKMQIMVLEEVTKIDKILRGDKKIANLIFEQKVVRVGKEDGEVKRTRKPRKPKDTGTTAAPEASGEAEPEGQLDEQEEEAVDDDKTPPWAKK